MRFAHKALLSATILAAVPAQAAIVIDFDDPALSGTVDDFYNGGTDSNGGSGANLGVSFAAGDWVVFSLFGQTSQPNFAYSGSGLGGFDVAAGFTSAFSFTAGAFTPSTVSIYSGLGGGGTLLAQLTGINDNPFAFGLHNIGFSGVAHSVVVSAGASEFGWDDLVIGSVTGGVPEPAQWALMIGGFGVAGAALRRRRAAVRVTYA